MANSKRSDKKESPKSRGGKTATRNTEKEEHQDREKTRPADSRPAGRMGPDKANDKKNVTPGNPAVRGYMSNTPDEDDV